MEQSIDLREIYDELKRIEASMITKKELNDAMETIEILSNKETMFQIEGSEKDIQSGEVKEINSVEELNKIWKEIDDGKGITLRKEEFLREMNLSY